MAISRANIKDIPSDAVMLSDSDACIYQWKIIQHWENLSEVWALRHGPGILGIMSGMSGIYINNYFRRKLKLGNFGRVSSYLPIVCIPSVMSIFYHRGFIQQSILLNNERCPVCLQTKAALYQNLIGVALPLTLAPLASLMYATRYYTFRLPSVTEKPKEILQLVVRWMKPIAPIVGAVLVGHSLMAMFITYKEIMNFHTVQIKLHESEKSIETNSVQQ